jgi:uncharacterized protein YhhL (DUF1145 family)
MIIRIPIITAGIIAAFFVIGVIAKVLSFLGPAAGGWLVTLFNLDTPYPALARDVENIGTILVFIISMYAGVIVYRTVIGNKKAEDISR